MKNLFKFIGAIILFTAFSFTSNAQSTLLGGGLSLFSNNGTEMGINAKGAIGFNESMEVSPSLNYYLTDGITLIGLNGDFHYLLGDEGSFRFYPLAGINFMMASANGNSNNEIQFNVGGGARYPVSDAISLYGEGKYLIGDFDGLVFSAGVMFNIGG